MPVYARGRTWRVRACTRERRRCTTVTEKIKIRVEFDEDKTTTPTLKLVRPHRVFYGRSAVTEPLKVEIEFEENEDLYGCICSDDEGAPGRSVRVEKAPGLVITPDPGLFGSDADRLTAKKLTFKKLKFGEWNMLNLEELV
jgi:hypothetical protein